MMAFAPSAYGWYTPWENRGVRSPGWVGAAAAGAAAPRAHRADAAAIVVIARVMPEASRTVIDSSKESRQRRTPARRAGLDRNVPRENTAESRSKVPG
ncbi:hypothetical protein GCM10027174_37690 [Salinifilum aidingensis]